MILPQSFLVVPDSCSQNELLCVSVDDQGKTVQDFPILQTESGKWNEYPQYSRLADIDYLQADKWR